MKQKLTHHADGFLKHQLEDLEDALWYAQELVTKTDLLSAIHGPKDAAAARALIQQIQATATTLNHAAMTQADQIGLQYPTTELTRD